MTDLDQLIDKWKKRLLDLGKRNWLINYRETKRSNIKIIEPGVQDLYTQLVLKEQQLEFPYVEEEFDDLESDGENNIQISGDLLTDRSIKEQQKTLRSLRNKARTAMEEQGVNILYLSLGFLHWKESPDSERILVSPIILVPVHLTVELITSPFVLSLYEDEIVVNPTLSQKLESDFGIKIPNLDSDDDDIEGYLASLDQSISIDGWRVVHDIGLSLLSFLKINMYYDLENNRERIKNNPILNAWSGDLSGITKLPEEFNYFDHDKNIKPIDTFQVVDADLSQQDAILYSKHGVSFVLQGPPGTGKSQTITNIIAEGLAEGKKILFVSEKMAALEVVLKRLTQSGLADFCLPLHSHRAKKKEVLEELGRTLNLNKFTLQEEALYKLEHLKIEREKLNQYNIELHTKCPPLDKTIFEVNGVLANLRNTPDVIFSLAKVAETTPEKLNKYKYLLNQLSRTIGSMSTDYTDNPWWSCHVPNVTHELRHNIETHLTKLVPLLKHLSETAYETEKELGVELDVSLLSLSYLIEILEVGSKSPKVPAAWFYREDISSLLEKARKYRDIKNEYQEIYKSISQNFSPEYFSLKANDLELSFISLITSAKQIINSSVYPTEENIASAAYSIISALQETIEKINNINQIGQDGSRLLGTTEIENLKNAKELEKVLESVLSNPNPNSKWFEPDNFGLLKRLIQETRNAYEGIQIETKKILEKYDPGIFDLNFSDMLKRFRVEYTSIFKIFKSTYRQDKKTIKSLSIEPKKKIDDEMILNVLTELKGISVNKEWISKNEEIIRSLFGSHYQGEYTDWNAFESAVTNFDKIVEYFGSSGIHEKTQAILLNGAHTIELEQLKTRHERIWESNFPQIITQTLNISDDIETVYLKELRSSSEIALSVITGLARTYELIKEYSITDATHGELLENLSKLVMWQLLRGQIEAQSDDLKSSYLFLFEGVDTDWDQIINSLTWMDDFKNVKDKINLTSDFIKGVCEDTEFIKDVGTRLSVTRSAVQNTYPELKWYFSLFDDRSGLLNTELYQLLTRTEKCLNGLSALEEWIDFRSSREKCLEEGLSEFIEKIQSLKIEKSLIVPTFLKRFYRLWLDSILPKFPAVYSFRRRSHEETIKEFSKLDLDQLTIARSRVRERLASQLPDLNRFTYSRDEVGILKRELNKQRRIMPLRKLFRAIPNLLLTLKPCLMMSPLSVSLYLEAASYNFDIVVFDEASQVCTEDAIGAIFRGSQVIITGDSKQLPPTNFFSTSISDNDFDFDDDGEDDYDDTDAYESVLEEAATFLPERTLRWHYRSRHEHLIAFSNEKIYNNNLITFPSPINNEKNIGVEYIHVPDGVYDRGGKRNNIVEAKKVAELVWNHIQSYPNRSLGVVTFSEAQQQAVETAIRQLRLMNQYYEYFFRDDREEPFFVKNLENVQGDERDSIIISIGYAKNQNGIMSLNFGPLNRLGGFRRLNVAITRAKYNVKLVGSIEPTDIAIENTGSEGVKLLRSYIEFAKNGDGYFQRELTIPETVNLESGFEEAVYDFLSAKGYNLATQVGCSGYRIDLAVKHPTLNGRFVLGIECDGAAYHSARTARERDRLRQTVLEDNGWKIYRVWSTDWIKDSKTEGKKLCDAIEYSISHYDESGSGILIKESRIEQQLIENQFPIEVPVETAIVNTDDNGNIYNFDYYIEANVDQVKRSPDDVKYIAEAIKYVVGVEYPIHFELLCKRLAPLFGNEKVTARVRDSVNYVMGNSLLKIIELEGISAGLLKRKK